MVLWRISRHLDLSGTGGLRAPGRWHLPGHPVVYLASTPSSALLEVCVHTSASDAPKDFTLLKVAGPDVDADVVGAADLPADWTGRLDVTRRLGMAFLRRRSSALLHIPSAIVPETNNFLLNPLHPGAAGFTIERAYSYPFDMRLKT